MKVSVLVLAVSLCASSAFAQRKGMNFGGLPAALLDQVVGEFSGALQPGLTQQLANDALVHLIHEQSAAEHPGAGVTGFMDAFIAFDELRTALANLKDAAATEVPGKVRIVNEKMDKVGALWKIGSLLPGFYSEPE